LGYLPFMESPWRSRWSRRASGVGPHPTIRMKISIEKMIPKNHLEQGHETPHGMEHPVKSKAPVGITYVMKCLCWVRICDMRIQKWTCNTNWHSCRQAWISVMPARPFLFASEMLSGTKSLLSLSPRAPTRAKQSKVLKCVRAARDSCDWSINYRHTLESYKTNPNVPFCWHGGWTKGSPSGQWIGKSEFPTPGHRSLAETV